jgi:hypothetical protein
MRVWGALLGLFFIGVALGFEVGFMRAVGIIGFGWVCWSFGVARGREIGWKQAGWSGPPACLTSTGDLFDRWK